MRRIYLCVLCARRSLFVCDCIESGCSTHQKKHGLTKWSINLHVSSAGVRVRASKRRAYKLRMYVCMCVCMKSYRKCGKKMRGAMMWDMLSSSSSSLRTLVYKARYIRKAIQIFYNTICNACVNKKIYTKKTLAIYFGYTTHILGWMDGINWFKISKIIATTVY